MSGQALQEGIDETWKITFITRLPEKNQADIKNGYWGSFVLML